MKNIIFPLLIGFAFLFIPGCKTSKGTTEVTNQSQQTQVLDPKNYVVWRQNIYPGLAVGDPANFLNSAEIILEGDIFHQTLRLENGKFIRMDTVHPISKNVREYTLGELVYPLLKDKYGRIIQMNISFSFNDGSYEFNFQRSTDDSFVLNGNATLILGGKKYPIKASSIGQCLLLIDFSIDSTPIPENGTAEGRQAIGTKDIKIK